MGKIILLDPLATGRGFSGHRHLLRDWTGLYNPGYICFPPLDLMYTAAFLRKYGHQVKIIEASVKHLSNKKVLEIIKIERPDFILLPSTFLSMDDDKHLSRVIRENMPDIKIIFSGPLVTYDPSLALNDGSADFVALGEYELPVLDIMRGSYAENIAYRNGDKIISGDRKLIDLNELPLPARDLIDNQAYRFAIFNRFNPVTTMTISRGCPHSRCKFCHSNLYTLGRLRQRNISSIIEEIKEAVFKYKIGEIFFRDQAFTADRELVWEACEYLISNNINISWRCSTRVDLVDKELLALMQRSGCFQVSFGFESCSQDSLDIADKGITIEQSRQAADWAKKAGLEVVGFFIYGLPGDSDNSMRDLYGFALELEVDYAQFNKFDLNPGAFFYKKDKAGEINLPPAKLIKKYVRNAYLKFYFRPVYLFKHLAKIRSFADFKLSLKFALDTLSFFILPYR